MKKVYEEFLRVVANKKLSDCQTLLSNNSETNFRQSNLETLIIKFTN